MKTTIDMPDALFERTKIVALQRRTTIKRLVIGGLRVLEESTPRSLPLDALARLRSGYHLGGKPLSREESHAGCAVPES